MKKLLLSLSILTFCKLFAEGESVDIETKLTLYEPGWDFLKDKFITESQENFELSCPKLRMAASIIVPAVASFAISSPIHFLGRNHNVTQEVICGLFALAIIGGCSFFPYTLCSIFDNYFLSYLEKKSALEFIANWERNKQYTPIQIHEFFDDIHSNYKKNPNLVKSDLSQIIKKIKGLI